MAVGLPQQTEKRASQSCSEAFPALAEKKSQTSAVSCLLLRSTPYKPTYPASHRNNTTVPGNVGCTLQYQPRIRKTQFYSKDSSVPDDPKSLSRPTAIVLHCTVSQIPGRDACQYLKIHAVATFISLPNVLDLQGMDITMGELRSVACALIRP